MENDLLFKLEEYSNSYINHLKLLNYSINTISTYQKVLNDLYEYLTDYDDSIKFLEIKSDLILNFLNSKEKRAVSTKSLYLNIIKAFFHFIDQKEASELEIRLKGINYKLEQKQKDSLSISDVQKLLHFIQRSKKSFNAQRDSLFIKLLLFTGIRASELLDITYKDIESYDDELYKILIRGKGAKQRYIYIQKDAIDKEIGYLQSLGYYKSEMSYLALTANKNRVSKTGLYNIISNKFKRAGIKKRGVHILRHTFAKNLVSQNVNLSTIKDMLGHENILTTMVYAKSDERNIVNVAKQMGM